MFHVYVLKSARNGQRYVGSCEDLNDRLFRHNAGQSKATKRGVPWFVIYQESFATRAEAVNRECYYKTGRGRHELARTEKSGRRGGRSQVVASGNSPRF